MKKFFPVVWLVLALACSAAVWLLSLDIYTILSAVYPMVTPEPSFAALVASIYVIGLVVMSFLCGVFTMMVFAVRTEKQGDIKE